jgi:hypothetical protein
MDPQPFPATPTEYRLSRHALEVGVVCAVLFGLAGVLSVAVALSNADGSFRHPVTAAVIFGVFWSCMTLLISGWLILAYFRYRLSASPEIIRLTGCFRTREVRLTAVTRAVWKSLLSGGSLTLYGHESRLTIHFGNYTFQERAELIRLFRLAVAEDIQEGWARFQSRWTPPQVDYKAFRSKMYGHLRFAVIAWATALPAMYAILIWAKLAGGFPHLSWVAVALLPLAIAGVMVGLMWLAARGDLARARGRQDAG